MLSRLIDWFRRIFRDRRPFYEAGADPFQKVDMERLRAHFRPSERGRDAGQSNLPTSPDQSRDANELEIESFFQGALTTSAQICDQQLKAFSQSILVLSPGHLTAAIERTRDSAVGDLATLARSGANQLHTTAQRAQLLSRHLALFKTEYGLSRPADYPRTQLYHWGLLAFLLVVETIVNGYMFAQGSSFGLIGGALEAVLFAFGNLVIGVMLGGFALSWFHYRSRLRRFGVGLPAVVVFAAIAVLYNLTVAHYRQALIDPPHINASVRALASLQATPLGLKDVLGWLLAGLGTLFCFIAAVDRLKMDDPHPGFGKHDRLKEAGQQEYADAVDEVYRDAADIRDEALSALGKVSSEQTINHQQQQLLLERSRHLRTQFDNHLQYLQSCFRTLISEYRSANRAQRSDSAPSFFSAEPTLLLTTLAALPSAPEPTDLGRSLSSAQAEIHQAYRQTIETFDSVRALTETANEISPTSRTA